MGKKAMRPSAAAAALPSRRRRPRSSAAEPDGNGHPYVGALLAQQAFSDGTWEECSGTLIAPKVFLTAEHCDEGVRAWPSRSTRRTIRDGHDVLGHLAR